MTQPRHTEGATELLPCPFCNDYGAEEAKSGTPNMRGGFKRSVYCNTCFAEGPPADTSEEAIEHWNTRAPAVIPEPFLAGWQLVPLKPTDEMLKAGRKAIHDSHGVLRKAVMVYSAMLAATPPAPNQGAAS